MDKQKPDTSGKTTTVKKQEPHITSKITTINKQELDTTGKTTTMVKQKPGAKGETTAVKKQEPYTTGKNTTMVKQKPGAKGETTAVKKQEPYTTGKNNTVDKQEPGTTGSVISMDKEEPGHTDSRADILTPDKHEQGNPDTRADNCNTTSERASVNLPQEDINWSDVVKVVKMLYPELLSKTYVVPPFHFNRGNYVVRRVSNTGVSALVAESPPINARRRRRASDDPSPKPSESHAPSSKHQDLPVAARIWSDVTEPMGKINISDVRDDFAQNHVLYNLQALADSQYQAMFILSLFNFSNYLNKPAYAAATERIPRPEELNAEGKNYVDGECDFVFINRQHGILIGELKSVGQSQEGVIKTQSQSDADVAKRVKQACKQLNRSEIVIKHLVSDVTPAPPVRKALFLPYVSRAQLQRILTEDSQLLKEVCDSLGAANAGKVTELCCCSDDLSDPARYLDVTAEVISRLETWWQHRMLPTVGPKMTDDQYINVVARFVGPASTVQVYCNIQPRVEVRTVGQAIAELGLRLTYLILTLEQLALMRRNDRLICITGPPGTGKTVVLVLRATQWLLQGHDVHIVSASLSTRAVSTLIKHQLQKTLQEHPMGPQSHAGSVVLHCYDVFDCEEEMTKAVSELSNTAKNGFLHVILDEAVFGDGTKQGPLHRYLVTKLIKRVPSLHLWAACIGFQHIPKELHTEIFSIPLRCAPAVLREVQAAASFCANEVYTYNDTVVPPPAEGRSIIQLQHQDGRKGHTCRWPVQCPQCGRNVAAELQRLGVGKKGSNLNYRDVFVLTKSSELHVQREGGDTTSDAVCGFVKGLVEARLPTRVLGDQACRNDKQKRKEEVEDTAIAKTDKITVAQWYEVTGLERRIVVLLQGRHQGADDDDTDHDVEDLDKLMAVSRCTTQLIIVK